MGGLQVGVINPGVILGPGFWNTGSGEVSSAVAKGLPFYTKGFTGFVTVSDVVELLAKLMKSDINGDRFVVISENIPLRDILNTIADGLKESVSEVQPDSFYIAVTDVVIEQVIPLFKSAIDRITASNPFTAKAKQKFFVFGPHLKFMFNSI